MIFLMKSVWIVLIMINGLKENVKTLHSYSIVVLLIKFKNIVTDVMIFSINMKKVVVLKILKYMIQIQNNVLIYNNLYQIVNYMKMN